MNVGFEERQVTLLDWQLATWGPPALELVPYLTASAASVDVSREEILASYRVAAGAAYDDDGAPCAVRACVELGWNKALDITENEDRLVRERERADLDWWVTEARRTIELGLLDGVVCAPLRLLTRSRSGRVSRGAGPAQAELVPSDVRRPRAVS